MDISKIGVMSKTLCHASLPCSVPPAFNDYIVGVRIALYVIRQTEGLASSGYTLSIS